MNLRNIYCNKTETGWQMKKEPDTKTVLIDSIPYPDISDWNNILEDDIKIQKMYNDKIKQINQAYPKNDRKGKIMIKNKTKLARNNLITIYMFEFMMDRDQKLLERNNELKQLGLWKHDRFEREDIIEAYRTQKGAKRFINAKAYNYFIDTGKQPFIISN